MASKLVKIVLVGTFAVVVAQAFAAVRDTVPASPQPVHQPKSVFAPKMEEATDSAEDDKIASGEHCLSGWDGSFPKLKDAVKQSLRNPRSFEHVETVRSPVNAKGKFGLIMTYRAENGFGGMNVDAIGVEVDADSCKFKQVRNDALAKYLRS